MSARLIVALCAAALCVLLVAPSTAVAQTATGDEPVASPRNETSTDRELVGLLEATGLTAEWLEAATVSDTAAVVEIVGDSGYAAERALFIDEISELAERRRLVDDRLAAIDRIERDRGDLAATLRSLRRTLASGGRSAGASLTTDDAAAIHVELAAITGTRRWMGISLDPVALAEHHLVSIRDEITKLVDKLERVVQNQPKAFEADVTRLTLLHEDLQRVDSLLTRARDASVRSQLEVVSQRATVISLMPDLHHERQLRPTAVGGLPVVTLDAYIRGAETLDASCPVEWNLLAGIGRVESRHGTIGDTTVQRSGRLSNPILGPLLDGGATEREAAEAAAAAEAALLAELEAQAAAAAEDPEEPDFDSEVWGEDTLSRAEELREAAAGPEGVGAAAPPVVVEEVPAPRYDPLLWGDDLPFDEDDLPPLEDEGTDDNDPEDDEEPEFRGNGFAVIEDSDNGVLDGNSRWDRAVGPMQFIPETWSYWATDGNGDGVTDPQNLYDAAASAGQFLCHLSRTRGSSPYTFVLGYNSSQTYVRNVMAVADAFGAVELP